MKALRRTYSAATLFFKQAVWWWAVPASSGLVSAQAASAMGQRVRNTQPEGGLMGLGKSPGKSWMVLLR